MLERVTSWALVLQVGSILGILALALHFACTAPGSNGGDILTPEGVIRIDIAGMLLLIAMIAAVAWFSLKIILPYAMSF